MTVGLAQLLASVSRAEDNSARFNQLSKMSPAELTSTIGGDPVAAAPWIRAAAAHGILEAQTRFGRMLLNGDGMAQDAAGAYRWFIRASCGGDGDAMNMVGRCYENGWGVPASDVAAACWYRRSAGTGHDWGEYNYAHILFDGRGGAARDRVAAFALYLRAAEKGHARAMNLVGRCLEAGWGVPPDKARARCWYARSAEAGYFRAQFNYASALVEQGRHDESLVWLKRAYHAGDEPIRTRISAMRTGIARAAKIQHPLPCWRQPKV